MSRFRPPPKLAMISTRIAKSILPPSSRVVMSVPRWVRSLLQPSLQTVTCESQGSPLRIAGPTVPTITAGLTLLLVTALLTVDGAPEHTFKLVSTGQSFFPATNIWALLTTTKISCSSICLSRSCPGLSFNPSTKVCQVFLGSAAWAPLTPVTGTRLYWIGGVMPTTTTSTTTTTTTTARTPVPGFTFVFHSEHKDFGQAKTACESIGAVLAAPTTPAQWEVFKNTVGPQTFNEFVRVWADDLDNGFGDFRWKPSNIPVNPVDFSTSWVPGRPSTAGWPDLDNCLLVIENSFKDFPCGAFGFYMYSFVCQEPVQDCLITSPPTCYIP